MLCMGDGRTRLNNKRVKDLKPGEPSGKMNSYRNLVKEETEFREVS